MSHTAVIVGGGIAGLAAAISLTNQGWQVTVAERQAEPREAGAGFAMSRNAVAAFRGLGFDADDVAALGSATRAAGTWQAGGRPILSIPDDPRSQQAVALIGVHRQRIHHLLLKHARDPDVEILPGTRVTHMNSGVAGGEPAKVAGREADLVVAADGMYSAVRNQLFPAARLTYSGYSSWRAITARTPEVTTLQQFWGPRAEFGIMPVSEEETYWYGYVSMPRQMEFADELAAARKRFEHWAQPVQKVLDATDPAAVIRHGVYHLPAAYRAIPAAAWS